MTEFEMDFVYDMGEEAPTLEQQLVTFKMKYFLNSVTIKKRIGLGGWPTIIAEGPLDLIMGMIEGEEIDDQISMNVTPAEIKTMMPTGGGFGPRPRF